MLDIFNSDAFNVVHMTQGINEITHVPSRIQSLGLFNTERVDKTTITIEKQGDLLILVPPSARGGPGVTMDKEKRNLRALSVPHFEINDAIYAEEVQGVRAFASETAMMTVLSKVVQRQSLMVNSFAATEEHARMGAVKGIVTYQNGDTLDLFSEFGVSQAAEIDFDLDNASPVEGVLRKKCASVTRAMTNALGGIPFGGIHAFCGDDFFDDLLAHPEVRETYKGYSEAQILRDSYLGPNRTESYGIFQFGGIVFENYRGSVGGTDFIDGSKAHMFPVGVPGLFRTVYAPADYTETVNTLGQRLYSRQYGMPNGKGVNLDGQMNALQYCARPNTLFKAKRT
ncbi:MAG: major capsid protein [Loktanella sp.]|nr:major capsid protein [Loktanella sp.]